MFTLPKRIVLVRHGESEGNVVSLEAVVHLGNIPNHAFRLTAKGKDQAEKTGKYLQERFGSFDAYFCSTYTRTQETLALMYPSVSPKVDSRLNEISRGVWNTMSKDVVNAQYPQEEQTGGVEGSYHYRALGGQNCPDVEQGIYSFLDSLTIQHSDESVLVAAHGNWMMCFWRVVLNKYAKEYEVRYATDKYKNAAFSLYERHGKSFALVEDNVVV
jgi:broad specificity phosphatase PhoE